LSGKAGTTVEKLMMKITTKNQIGLGQARTTAVMLLKMKLQGHATITPSPMLVAGFLLDLQNIYKNNSFKKNCQVT